MAGIGDCYGMTSLQGRTQLLSSKMHQPFIRCWDTVTVDIFLLELMQYCSLRMLSERILLLEAQIILMYGNFHLQRASHDSSVARGPYDNHLPNYIYIYI